MGRERCSHSIKLKNPCDRIYSLLLQPLPPTPPVAEEEAVLVEEVPVVIEVAPPPAPVEVDEMTLPEASRHWHATERVAGELAVPVPRSMQSNLTEAVRGNPSQVVLQAFCSAWHHVVLSEALRVSGVTASNRMAIAAK